MSGPAPSDVDPSSECAPSWDQVADPEPTCIIQDCIAYPLDRQLAAGLTSQEYSRVCAILVRNLTSRRALRVMGHYAGQLKSEGMGAAQATSSTGPGALPCPTECWMQYQLRVIRTFEAERSRYDALFAGDANAWETLTRQLTHAAQRMLLHNGFGSLYAREQAAEMSQQTCEHIVAAPYPWDISFDLWSHTIMRNIFLQRYTRSHDLMDRVMLKGDPLELDEVSEWTALDAPADPYDCTAGGASAYPDASELIEAIEQMQSRQRRAVILYTYYEELSDEEIAQEIGKSRNAVQTLRHRALRQLRTLLGLP